MRTCPRASPGAAAGVLVGCVRFRPATRRDEGSDMDNVVRYSRRDFGKLAFAALPAASILGALADTPLSAGARINSRIKGVRIGAITYSFRTIPDPLDIIKAY